MDIVICTLLGNQWYVAMFRSREQLFCILLNNINQIYEKINTCKTFNLLQMGDSIYALNHKKNTLANVLTLTPKITNNTVLVFKGVGTVNVIRKGGKVKKNDLIIKNNTIIWKRAVYHVL